MQLRFTPIVPPVGMFSTAKSFSVRLKTIELLSVDGLSNWGGIGLQPAELIHTTLAAPTLFSVDANVEARMKEPIAECPLEGWTIIEAAEALCPELWVTVPQRDIDTSDTTRTWSNFLPGENGKSVYSGHSSYRGARGLTNLLDALKSKLLGDGYLVKGRPGPDHSEPISIPSGVLHTLNLYRWRDNVALDEYGLIFRDVRIFPASAIRDEAPEESNVHTPDIERDGWTQDDWVDFVLVRTDKYPRGIKHFLDATVGAVIANEYYAPWHARRVKAQPPLTGNKHPYSDPERAFAKRVGEWRRQHPNWEGPRK